MLLLIDKPKGITSHDVVDIVRRKTGERRVGHAGTLDPLASGLLIIGVGRESTKLLGNLSKNTTKTYEAEITLGATSDTDDGEGVISLGSSLRINRAEIIKTLKEFVGEQDQIPPNYSAIKLQGKKAYELARKGLSLSLSLRKVTIHSIKLIDYLYPKINIVCEVSSGTYIRSLARDIGAKLGTGAYLSALRRTKIGDYDIVKAKTIDQL